ncbi:MAG: hypothetical protein M1814_006753 [Vezdaea aestivalis]|nr:MAG: hypothetical protein M1814_006753 [Vezdaea aestivalis]
MASTKDYSKSKRRGAINPTNSLGASTRPRQASPGVQKSSASHKAPAPAPRRNPTRAATVHETDLSSDTDGIVVQISAERRRMLPAPRDKDVFMSGALGPGDWSRKPKNAEEKHAMKAQRAADEKAQIAAEKRYEKERLVRRKAQKDKIKVEQDRVKEEKARAKLEEKIEKARVAEAKRKTAAEKKDAADLARVNKTKRTSRGKAKTELEIAPAPLTDDEEDSSINAPLLPTVTASIAKPKASPLGPTTIKRRKRASSIFSPERDDANSKLASGPPSPGNSSYLASAKFGANGVFDNANDSEIERNLARELELDESFLPEQVSASPYVVNNNNNITQKADETATQETVNTKVTLNGIKSTTPPGTISTSLKRKLSATPSSDLPSSPPSLHVEQKDPRSLTPLRPTTKLSSPVPSPPKSSSPVPQLTKPTNTTKRALPKSAPKPQPHIPTTIELQSYLPRRRTAARTRLRSTSKQPLSTSTQRDNDDGDSSPLSSVPSDTESEGYGENPRRRKAGEKKTKKRGVGATTKSVGPRAAPKKVYGATNGGKATVKRGESDKENKAVEAKEGELAGSLGSNEGSEERQIGAEEVNAGLVGVKEKFKEVDDWNLDFEDVTKSGFESSPLDAR